MARPTWTDARVAVLRRLVEQRLTGEQIAEHFGVSRSAVIAAVNRECRTDPTFPRLQPWHGGRARTRKQNSPAGSSSRSPENSPGRGTSSRPARGASAAERVISTGVALMELTAWHCRWPLAGPSGAGQLFCGCRRADGKAYCEPHVARARGAGSEGARAAARIGRAA